jgi:anti-sigma B factor antagonist
MKKRRLGTALVVSLTSVAFVPAHPAQAVLKHETQDNGRLSNSAQSNVAAQSDNLNIKERQACDVTILDLDGKITTGKNSDAMLRAIRDLLAGGKKKILLNLAGVSHIDSGGIGALVSGHTAIMRADGRFKLFNLTVKLKDLLAITKLMTVFDVYEDEPKALASFDSTTTTPVETPSAGSNPSAKQKVWSKSAVESKVRLILVDELGVAAKEVTPYARIEEDLGADSLDAVELVMRFEEEFGIEIPDADALEIKRVCDIDNYLWRIVEPRSR